MQDDNNRPELIRFGKFVFNPETGEIEKDDPWEDSKNIITSDSVNECDERTELIKL